MQGTGIPSGKFLHQIYSSCQPKTSSSSMVYSARSKTLASNKDLQYKKTDSPKPQFLIYSFRPKTLATYKNL